LILDGRASLGDVNSRAGDKPTQLDGIMAASNSATESGGYDMLLGDDAASGGVVMVLADKIVAALAARNDEHEW
jgi:hypothetical protein